MKLKIRKPLYLYMFIFFACTDIYLISGIKLAYVFVIPMFISMLLKKMNLKISIQDAFLLLWFATYFLSIGHIVSITDFIFVVAGQIILFIVYLYLENISSQGKYKLIERFFILSLSISVGIGLLQIFLYYTVGSTWGISHMNTVIGLPRMRGLSLEPDWYGCICMVNFIMLLCYRIDGQIAISKKMDKYLIFLSAIMLILCMTRAAWLGTIVALIIIIFFRRDSTIIRLRKYIFKFGFFLLIISALLLVLLNFSNHEIFTKIISRFDFLHWSSNDGGAMDSRRYAIEVMMIYFRKHPFTGNGVGGMGMISSNQSLLSSLGYYYEINAGRGSANLFITNLFDVGIFGTIFLTLFLLVIIFKLFKAYEKYKSIEYLMYALLIIALLVDFQFNNGLRLAFVWVILGISSFLLKRSSKKEMSIR